MQEFFRLAYSIRADCLVLVGQLRVEAREEVHRDFRDVVVDLTLFEVVFVDRVLGGRNLSRDRFQVALALPARALPAEAVA